MGQESGRAAWPRPAGYQTITGRRYGRRHAYISFRPNFKASGRYRNQNPARVENWEGPTRDNLTTEQHIAPKSPLSTMLHSILPVPNSVHPEHRGRTGREAVSKKQPSSRRLADGPTIHYKKLKSDPPVTPDPQSDSSGGSEKNKKLGFWPETEERLTNSALGFVNIDAYEPDSSGGEEESAGMSEGPDPPPLGQQRRLDSMIFELGKDFDYLRGLHSFLYTKTDPSPKESADMDRGAGSDPEGDDAKGRLGEWTGAGERAGSGNHTGERMNDTGDRNNGTGAEADATDEMESRTGAEVEAEERMRAEVEAEERMRAEVEAEERMRAEVEAEERMRAEVEAEERMRAEVEVGGRMRAEAEDRMRAEAEERMRAEVEVGGRMRAEVEAEERMRAEAEEKMRVEAGGRMRAEVEAEERMRAEVEAGGRMRAEVEAEERMRAEVEVGGRMRAEVEAEERMRAEAEEGLRARESRARSGAGDAAVASPTATSPACQRPLTASTAADYPACPPGSLESGAGAFPGPESGWRQLGEWQRLGGGSQDSGAWGADERGAAGSSACPPEPVVRPKIRKQSSETHLEQKAGSDGGCCSEPPRCGSASRPGRPARTGTQAKCVSAPPFFLTQTDRPNPELLFSFPPAERIREEEERMREWLERKTEGLRRRREEERRRDEEEEAAAVAAEEEEGCRLDSDDDDIWEDLDVFNDKTAPFIKAEDSSECSEGEWFWPPDSGLDKERGSSEEERDSGKEERRSSEESWETLPGLEEISSTSSSLEEPAPLSTDTGGPQPQLEEGEIPWLMYNQEASSSEDEEGPDPGSHFVHPGLFILDGNNNMDDDSSMSEDLDAEWRLLDDFGDGFGMAQAISYVDPQLLTYMALEERLAQAMEAALAHLESLAIDVEQAHPPATEQIIDCLPHITIQEENSGQEQCCAICCSEYVREEVATQLPCNHMFHKLCVTLWLQKSGTCPVCRHILTPPLPEAPPPTSFLSDQEVPPSNHSTAGTR